MSKFPAAILIAVLFFYGCSNHSFTKSKKFKSSVLAREEEEENENKYDHAMELADWEFRITKDPVTNNVPRYKIIEALDYEKQRLATSPNAVNSALSGMNWNERGPDNIGGRTRTILIDANDASNKTVWAGAVDGGLWKTTDISQSSPSWTAVSDLFSNLAITGIAQDSSSNDTMYFCTGEGWYNVDAVQGLGVWRSTNAGLTWSQISSTNANSDFYRCQKIVVNSTHDLFVATGTGLWKLPSGNPSNTWTRVYTAFIADVEIAPSGRIHLCGGSAFSSGFYAYSDNNGSSWNSSTSYNTLVTSSHRTELAVAPNNSNYIYAIVTNTSNVVSFFLQSTDAGVTWSAKTIAANGADFTNGQGWYNLALAVDPTTASSVYCAGLELYKSTNGGTSWTRKTSWTGSGLPYVHADNHIIMFEQGSSTNFYCGNDGGIFYTNDGATSFTDKNNSYNVTQYYAASIHPTAYTNFFIAGAQDNGSHLITSSGTGSAVEVTGGDGAYCHIETDEPQYIYTSYVRNNFYRSSDNGSTFGAIVSDNNGPFITAWDFDNRNNILYAAYTANNYRRYTNMHGTPSGTTVTLNASAGTVTHVKVSPNVDTTVYFGTDGGKVYRVTTANGTPTITNISGASFAGSVSCVEIEKGNENHILVTFSNYSVTSVWQTYNGGTTWKSVEGNLPDLPVRWALFSPLTGTKAMIATETGVYSTDYLDTVGSTGWGINSSGMPNVRVDMLKIRASDSLVLAATHGRGMFTTDVFTTAHNDFDAENVVAYLNQPIQFNDRSYKATSWSWDFDNNGSVDATTQNPQWAYGTSGYKTVKLVINGALTKTLTNYIQVLPNKGLPYTTAQGGDFESNASDFGAELINGTNWERGNSSVSVKNGTVSGSNAWVTGLTSSGYSNNNVSYLYSPNFNFYNTATDSLKFYQKNSFETGYDGMIVEYSTNQGASWNSLGTTTGSTWYDFANTTGNTAFTVNQAFFNATNSSFTQKKYDVSFLSGNKSVGFRFSVKSDASVTSAGVAIDNFEITSTLGSQITLNVETATASKSEMFGPNETDTFYSSNGKILAVLQNNSAHDYGLTTVTIDNAGTGAINYATNTSNALKLFQKTLTIVPTTNNVSGTYTISLFYDATEISGWRSITSNSFTGTNILKCPVNIASGTIANGVYGSATTRAAYGSFDSSITVNFSTGFSGFGLGADIVILPVDLLRFNAVKKETNVVLDWATGSEKNNMGFDIERRTESGNWTKISFEPGKGTSYNRHDYQYVDLNAFEIADVLYYRLKQIDFNGEYKYSAIRVVTNKGDRAVVTISPQPVKNLLTVTTSLKDGFVYSILTGDGKDLIHSKENTNIANINIDKLPSGIYYIRIEDGENIETQRFVKVN